MLLNIFRSTILILVTATLSACSIHGTEDSVRHVDNPYRDIDWESVHYLHSSTHQHARPYSTPSHWYGRDEARLDAIYAKGLRHFALSNYVPSVPVYPFFPLPDHLQNNDEIISAPNAEHRTTTDYGMHFNTVGSYYRSGYHHLYEIDTDESPFIHIFDDDNQTVYDPGGRESDGGFHLAVTLRSRDGSDAEPRAYVTLEGAVKRESRGTVRPAEDSEIKNWEITGSDGMYLIFKEEKPRAIIEYDPASTEIQQLRLTARTLLPFRQAFSEALDGDLVDDEGNPLQGLQFEDGGGIVINHPGRADYRDYLTLLDFDDRVLGMEIWNHRRTFGAQDRPPHDRFYSHWDNILSTGRRMYGFATQDHRWKGRGRSVLLVPPPEGRTREQRKRDALRAYRQGQFLAVVGAIDTDEEGNLLETGDYTDFRVDGLHIEKSESGEPVAVRVSVTGNDISVRPNVQIRFITDEGMEKVVNAAEGRFELPLGENGQVQRKYVRIEALAFPDTHNQGEALTAEMMERMNVYDIAKIHDFRGDLDGGLEFEAGNEPIGTVDMLFSQPVRFPDI